MEKLDPKEEPEIINRLHELESPNLILKNKVNKIYLSNSFLNHKEVVKFLIGDCIDLIDKNRIVRVKLINWLLSQPKKNSY